MSAEPTPFIALVAADFAATNSERATLQPGPNGLAEAFAALKPRIELGAPCKLTLEPRSLAGFGPPALGAALAATGALPEGAAARADRLHAALRDPRLLAVEAAWRGLARVLEAAAVDGPHAVAVHVASVARQNLVDTLTERALTAAHADPRTGPALIVVDAAFSGEPGDVEALTALCAWGRALGAPVLAQADPRMLGVRHLVHVPALPDLPQRLRQFPSRALDQLRRSEEARWLGLVLGRWLARPAHVSSEPDFTETFVPERPEGMPFAGGVWLALAGILRSMRRHGHAADAYGFTATAMHEDLPTARPPGRPRTDGTRDATDARLEDGCAVALLRHGFTPLVARPAEGVAAFAMLSNLHRPDGARLTAADSFSHVLYQACAARAVLEVARRCTRSTFAAEVEATLAAWIDSQTATVTTADASTPRINVVAEDEGFEVTVKPPLRLDGRGVEATVWISATEIGVGA